MKTDKEIMEEAKKRVNRKECCNYADLKDIPSDVFMAEVLSIRHKEILWLIEDRINWHRTECRFIGKCSACEILSYLKKQIEEEK